MPGDVLQRLLPDPIKTLLDPERQTIDAFRRIELEPKSGPVRSRFGKILQGTDQSQIHKWRGAQRLDRVARLCQTIPGGTQGMLQKGVRLLPVRGPERIDRLQLHGDSAE